MSESNCQQFTTDMINPFLKLVPRLWLELRWKEVPQSRVSKKLSSGRNKIPQLVRSYSRSQITVRVHRVNYDKVDVRIFLLWRDNSFGLPDLEKCTLGPRRGVCERFHERLIVQDQSVNEHSAETSNLNLRTIGPDSFRELLQ